MIEDDLRAADELRAAFARHERLTPAPGPVRAAIDRKAVRRRRRRLGVRATGAALAVITAVAVPALGRALTAPAPPPVDVPVEVASPGRPPVPPGALNFLLVGVDGRSGSAGEPDVRRADAVLIVHIPRDRSRLHLISLPRDLAVEIPGAGRGKLNGSFRAGDGAAEPPALADGVASTARTVTGLTGITFDGTAALTYTGLSGLTDAAGGVRVCLAQPVRSAHTGRNFPTGCQELDGRKSVDLLRQRIGLPDGAQDRDRNAQRLIRGLLDQVVDGPGTNPAWLMKLIVAAGDGLVIDTGDLSLADLYTGVRDVLVAEPIGISLPVGPDDGRADGGVRWAEPTAADALFAALREDKLTSWVSAHPGYVTHWAGRR